MNKNSAKILLVEDEIAIRQLLGDALKRAGFVPVQAADASEGLRLLAAEQFDLVLLDLHMPGPADGEDLLFDLRDRGDQIPVIIISGWVDDQLALEHPDCVQAVLKKPLQLDRFIAEVHQALTPS